MHSYKNLTQKLNGLTVFRGLLSAPPILHLQKLLQAMEKEPFDADAVISTYSSFTAALFPQGINFSEVLLQKVLTDENFYLSAKLKKSQIPALLEETALRELAFLSELARFSSQSCKTGLSEELSAFLPDWETTALDFPAQYQKFLSELPQKGFGMFSAYHVFLYDAEGLHPVMHPDPQQLSQLSGYERETGIVLRNTEALLSGGTPSNLLLYGDAGTGKSSTIKAVANAYPQKGLRLIEIKKEHLHLLPKLMELLAENPLKFIVFIDDLTFSGNDAQFSALKGILEGSVAARAKNTVIYATSNRRHLVKENADDRSGNDLHLNDTLQEVMSLSARFGMTITYQKPDKAAYLSIVQHLAQEYGLQMPQDELFQKAETFAIRQNGRSPRTAKHFVETQLANL